MTRRSFIAGMGAAAAAASASRLPRPRRALASDDHRLPDGHIVVLKRLSPASGGGEPAPLAGVLFAARRIYSEAERRAAIANDPAAASQFVASATFTDGETYTASELGGHLPDVAGSFSGFMFREGDAWIQAATGEDGRADICTGQSFGAFILIEDAASSSAAGSVTLIEPCVVNLPSVDEQGRALYTVEAHPKNRELGRLKSIELDDGSLASAVSMAKGDAVRYVVDGQLPFNVDGLASYVIWDKVDPRLDFKRVLSLTCSAGFADGASSSDEAVVAFAQDTGDGRGDYTALWSNQELTVALKADSIRAKVINPGLMTDQLVDGDKAVRTSTVRLRFECVLRNEGASEAASGDYPNTATVRLMSGSGTTYEAQTDETHAYNVKIEVHKRSPAGAALAGAVFGIADSLEHARAEPPLFLSETMDGQGAAPLWVGEDTATTGADGLCAFTGLPFDLEAGADYWVREISAPSGYGIVAEPIKVHVGGLDESREAGFSYAVEVTDSPAGFLPTTGGVRSYAGIAAGSAVAAAGVAAAIATGRRRRAEEEGQAGAGRQG